jgi:NOL1/NOP2/fmu family ribosome biogenesis protein
MVAGCALRQSVILRVAAKMVRPGGYLLYSTCTFAPEENEAVIAGLLGRAADGSGIRFQPVALPQADGFMPGRPDWLDLDGLRRPQSSELERAVRLFPHRVQGEGHFACLLQRLPSSADDREEETQLRSDRLPKPSKAQSGFWRDFAGQVLAVDLGEDRLRAVGDRLYFVPQGLPDLGRLRVVHPGVWLGALKKDRFEPAHPLALFLRRGQARRTVDLPVDDPRLRAYLRGESFTTGGPSEPRPAGAGATHLPLRAVQGGTGEPVEGWAPVTVDGFPLGWGKRVQGLVKNHFPRGWIQGQAR